MRRGTRISRLANALACVALVVAGCAGEPAAPTPSGEMHLRIGMFGAGSTLPVHAAVATGIFERRGLHVEITDGQDLPLFMAALSKGQYDIVMSGPTLVLIGVEKGLDLQVIASLQRSSQQRPNAVWITKDPAVDTLDQLKGTTIGVPSLTGIIADATKYLLSKRGVGGDEIKFIQTPFATMGDQLAAGRIDAAVASIPFNEVIAARGFRVHSDIVAEAVSDASDGAVQSAMTSIWVASSTFTKDHPELVQAWRDAMREAVAYLDGNESEARAMMHDWLKIPTQIIDKAPLPDWDTEIAPAEMLPYITISKAVGSTSTDPELNTLVWQGP